MKEGRSEGVVACTPIVAWQQRRAFVFTRFGVCKLQLNYRFLPFFYFLFSLSLSLSLSSSSSSSSPHSLFSWVMHFSLSPTILMHHQFSSFSFLWKAFQEISQCISQSKPGGHHIFMNISPRKEDCSCAYSLRIGRVILQL